MPTRYFAVTYADDQVVFPELAYPVRKVIVPIWLATLLAAGIPATCILAMQIRYRSFWDANNAIMGLLYSLVTAAAFQALLKWLIGGLRPHFLAACKPDMRLVAAAYAEKMGGAWDLDSNKESHHGDGFGNLYFTRDICTGTSWDVSDSLESFPSGHTTAVFAGFVFLSLYFNGKLKLFADHVSRTRHEFSFTHLGVSLFRALAYSSELAFCYVEIDFVPPPNSGCDPCWRKSHYRLLS